MKHLTLISAITFFVLASCAPQSRSTLVPALTADMLVIETYELTGAPDPDTLRFTSVDGRGFTSADLEVCESFPSKQVKDSPLALSVKLQDDTIVAEESAQADNSEGSIIVTRNGEEIFRTAAGGISPINPLQDLWAYDDHWVLETNLFLEDKPFNGRVFLDGESIGQQNGYEEVFNFQTISKRPFYFFRRNGKVDAWFDGQEVSLGYDDVPHYQCCSASSLNPRAFLSAVVFFGVKGDTWYFVRIGVPGVLD
jgi:hypothetical protein